MLENEKAGISSETAQTNGEVATEQPATMESTVNPGKKQDRVFTRDEVTTILRKRLDRSNKAFYQRFGVDSDEKLNEYITNHNSMAEELQSLKNNNLELTRTNSFLRNNINPDKYDDIITYFKGKGIDFSEDELLNLITTHGDWVNQPAVVAAQPVNQTTIQTISPERGHVVGETPDEKSKRIFGY